MKLVLDTDSVVTGFRSPGGASAELLRMARRSQLTMLVSVPLFLEYEAKCLSSQHLKAADLTQVEGQAFLDAIARFAQPVAIHYRWRPQLNDPVDEMVLETAVNGQAEAIVTFNQRHFSGVSGNFGIQTWLPAEALRMMR